MILSKLANVNITPILNASKLRNRGIEAVGPGYTRIQTPAGGLDSWRLKQPPPWTLEAGWDWGEASEVPGARAIDKLCRKAEL